MRYSTKRLWAAKAALLTVAILWGSSLLVAKKSVDSISPSMLIALRFTVACILLGTLFRKKLTGITRKQVASGAMIGAFLFGAYWIQTVGVTLAMPGKSAFLSSIYCVLEPFASWFFTRRRPPVRNLLATVVCAAGIFLTAITDDFSILPGDVFALLSGIFFALHIASVGKYGAGEDPILMTILQFGFCALYAWIVTLLTGDCLLNLNTGSLLGIVYLAIFCTGIALLLQNVGQKYVSSSSASILMSTESIFGILFSVLLYGETVTLRMVVGFVMIFVSVLISEIRSGNEL